MDGVVDGSAIDGTDLDPANDPFLIEASSTAVQLDDHAVDAEEEWIEALDTMETLQALSNIIAPPSEVE
jgi:hypothetical protein